MVYKAYARFMVGNFDLNVINKFNRYKKKNLIPKCLIQINSEPNTIIISIETLNLSLILFTDHRS